MHNHDNPQDPDASSDTHDSGPATFHAFMEERLGDVMSFRNSLADETDRGVALMSAAYLEDRLGVLFGRHFVQNEKVIKEMIGQNRPLGTFSARISLAYLLGLIGPKIYRDLELIRRIRNQFAHEPKALAFDAPEIRSRSLELHTHTFETGAAPREVFTRTVMGILAAIDAAILKTSARGEGGDYELGPESKRQLNDLIDKLTTAILQDSDEPTK